jgi:hypothetical protein
MTDRLFARVEGEIRNDLFLLQVASDLLAITQASTRLRYNDSWAAGRAACFQPLLLW